MVNGGLHKNLIFVMKKQTTYLNIFRLMSLSIHSLFTIKAATKILSYNQSVIIIVGN